MFSIVIPSFNNLEYLKLCLNSLKKNSKYKHQIIVHINEGTDGSLDYVKKNNIEHTYTEKNVGLCSAVNTAAKKASTAYILYSHDDMYFCPEWDDVLLSEINKNKNNLYYLSGTMINPTAGHITFDCGNKIENFDESKLLNNYKKLHYFDFQGSHWAPHLIHKDIWDKIGGFSEEFNPGFASDPDLNMKLWVEGNRVFKSVSKSRIYHFGSITTRKNKKITKNNGKKTFLLKWKMTVEFFTKYYLRRGEIYNGPLNEPNKNLFYYIDFLISKSKFCLTKYFK